MNESESIAPCGAIERELNENTLLALVKYARHIVRFHYRGMIADLQATPSDAILDREATA